MRKHGTFPESKGVQVFEGNGRFPIRDPMADDHDWEAEAIVNYEADVRMEISGPDPKTDSHLMCLQNKLIEIKKVAKDQANFVLAINLTANGRFYGTKYILRMSRKYNGENKVEWNVDWLA